MREDTIEDIYALSPMQTGMLFHTLYAGEHAVYLDQQVHQVQGNLNASAFKRAWEYLLERHPVLRTTFHWDGLEEPLQVVHRRAELPLEHLDWRNLSEADKGTAFAAFLKVDRERAVDLTQAPLMRLVLIRMDADNWLFGWTLHHLLLDRWSIAQVLSELGTAYAMLCSGQRISLPPLPPYSEYIGWLQEQDPSRAEAYWRGKLAGFSKATTLPIDRAPGSQPGRDLTERQHLRLSEATNMALQSMARQHHLTLNTLIQGAWALLLGRYTGEEEILFGTTVSGRPPALPGVASMVGMFINSLPVRVHIPGASRLVDWLQQLQTDMAELREYEYSSLLQIQSWSDIPRGVPLFDSLVVVQNNQPPQQSKDLQKPETTLQFRSISSESSVDFPLLLLAVPGRQVDLWLNYDSARYDPHDIGLLLEHLGALLEAMAADPYRPLHTLSLLTEAERHQILVEWNDTRADYPQDRCVHQFFEAQALRTPDAIALVYEEQTLTYRELDARANQLAHLLHKQGVGTDTLVGLCLERSLDMVVSLLAILKTGAAYVPLDPAWPQERLHAILIHSAVASVVTQTALRSLLPDTLPHTFCLDQEAQNIDAESPLPFVSAVTSGHLAYVLHTSGSTGAPKGVPVPHRAVVNFLASMARAPGLEAQDVLVAVTTLSFDIAGLELYLPLMVGARVVLASRETAMDGVRLGALLEESGATVMQATPSTWRLLLDCGRQSARGLKVLCGGEALPWDLAERLVSEFGGVWNLYGPTETTIWSSVEEITTLAGPLSIGRPIANTQMYVLDRWLSPVGVGVTGELYIGGDGLAWGYLKRPELTAEKFVADPFSSQPGSRMYRTGDLARYLADGKIECLGRVDHQVKIRGFRIELGEIESVLSQHPGVKEAVVVAREDAPGEKRLVAYIVAGDDTLNTGVLRAHLREKLPDYMVPAAFVTLEALPLTPNGKINRNALPVPDLQERADTYVAPRNPIEEGLAEIWAGVLHREQVSVHDSFFELGGHSLLATQVISRIRSTFQAELPLRVLFEAPTVAGLAEHVRAGLGAQSAPAPSLVRVSRERRVPLSFAQQRMWFLDQFEPGSSVYIMPSALRLVGVLDQVALEQSLQELVHRHETLRTTFIVIDGEPVQVVGEAVGALEVTDLSGLAPEECKVEALRRIAEESQRPFDLERGPLFRTSLLRLAAEDHILLLTTHHIVSDGWSLGIMMRELEALYNALHADRPVLLAELPIQYADYAAWQRAWLQGETLERQLAYWREQLAGIPALLELPTDRPRPAVRTFPGARKTWEFSARLTEGIKALGQTEGTTLFMTLLAAFQVLLFRYSGQDQIVVGTPIANRTQEELEGLIGFFANTLALRGDLSGDPSFRELLGRIREVALGAYAHQDLPFERLVEELQPERSLSHPPLFQVMFMLQNAPRGGMDLTDLQIESIRAEGVTAKYDLLLGASEGRNGVLRLGLEYNTDLFDGERIERLLGHLQTLLEAIVADPEQQISRLQILSASDRQQLLAEWNDTRCPFPDRRLHQLVEVQAERTPDAVALRFESDSLTYRELEERANRLAHTLQSLGVRTGGFVGVALERSLDLIVALLGVLKAGAAYLPLDPDYPSERLASMLDDARVSVLLSQEAIAARLSGHNAVVLCLDRDGDRFAAQSSSRPQTVVDAEDPAYLLYTSGSTGRPKGVVVPHRAILNHMEWMQQTFPLTSDDRLLQKTSLSFDASVWECWAALMVGAELVLARPGGQADPAYLAALIQERQITTLKLVPSLLQMLLDEPSFGVCTSLRQIFCGAEALPRELPARFFACFAGSVALHNLYGPTEAAIDATGFTCRPDWERSSVPIGRPISNVSAYLLDGNGNPVPIGVAGELYLGGTSLAHGYLNLSDLTAEKFVPDPFGNEPGARLYRTGDLCRYLADGNIDYLGRLDYQVKIRGFRIELGEIESALLLHPTVREALVLAREDTPGDKRLVAYIVGAEETANAGALREHLSATLPSYMTPTALMFLKALPLSANGKVDRKALPAPEAQEQGTGYVAPRTPIEEGIAAIWSEVLHREQVDVHANFFDLGGHSLLATQVIARVRETFQVDLPLRTLFDAPTVAQLAERVLHLQRGEQELIVPPLRPQARTETVPLSFSQQRLWFLDQLQPGSSLYNVPRVLSMRGDLDLPALHAALQEILRRHEVLRTHYGVQGSNPVQLLDPDALLLLPLHDLSSLEIEERKEEALRLCREEAAQPFDLARDLMMRGQVLRLQQDEHLLLLTLHHIAFDGWSSGILTQELSALYNAFCEGRPSPLPPLPIQYADYALWQRECLQGEALQQQVDYWKTRLAGAPPVLALPTDRPREQATSYQGAVLPFVLSPEAVAGLRRLCRTERATPFMALLAAFKVLLYRWTGQTDLVVGTDVANRTQAQTESLIGFFLNHLVLRTDLSGEPTFSALVGRVREGCLGAYTHQDMPFEKLVEVLQPERSASHTPLFQVLFVLQNAPRGMTQLQGLELGGVGSGYPTSKYDLSLFLSEHGGNLRGVWVYRTDLFSSERLSRLSEQFTALVGELMAHPERIVEDVELKAVERKLTAEESESGSPAGVRGARRRTAVVVPPEPLLD